MNNGEMEFITFGTKLCLIKQDLLEIGVGDDVVKGSDTMKFLGLILDKELNMTKFIAAKARTAHFNIEKIKRIRNCQAEDETKMLLCSMILSHLDYDNTTLAHLPKSALKPLQFTPNYAAKVSCKKQKYDSSIDCLSTFTGYQYSIGVRTNS